tara:strand:- start:383 stop:1369 length:987 start_codon:yes stop_codon:yes gene_type:complete
MIKNKTILVTGCFGFVAQHLINKLLINNNRIVGIYNRKYQLEIYDNKKYIKNKKYIILKGDIRNKYFINKLLKSKNFDFCFHLAAISQVLDSNKDPIETFDVNLFGTINILDSIRKNNLKTKTIFSSSDKVYGDNKDLPYTEDTNLNALNPYDASKASADIISRTYASTFNTQICVTRFVNIYGPGDVNWNRLIPGTIKNILFNKKPIIRSNGKFLRDYLYIDDVIDGYLKIAKNFESKSNKINGLAFNFGSKKPESVISVVEKINFLLNKNKLNYVIKNISKNEIKDQYSTYKLAKKYLNWSPKTSLEKGLLLSINWYLNNKNSFDT